jgi:hypothetical protein
MFLLPRFVFRFGSMFLVQGSRFRFCPKVNLNVNENAEPNDEHEQSSENVEG